MIIMEDNDGQMIFGGLKLPDICLTDEEKPQKNLTQEICPDQGSNPGLLHDRCTCYCLAHSGGRYTTFTLREVETERKNRGAWLGDNDGSVAK